MRRFLGGERQQVDGFVPLEPGYRLEAAGQQDLLDQTVELGDVALQPVAGLRIGLLAQHRGRHRDAGERRAQLVAAVGEQQPVGGDQLLDALGGAVEARGQRGHLVAALDLDAGAEVAAAELLDAFLQPLEPPAEPAHDGIGADRDGEREQGEAAHDPQDRARPLAHLAGHQPAAVGKLQGEGRAARAAPPAVARAPRIEARRRPAGHGDLGAVAAVEGEVEAQLAMQRIERLLVLGLRRVGIGQQGAGQLGGDVEILRRLVLGELPDQRRRADEHRQHQQDGDVELEIEALHLPSRPERSRGTLLSGGERLDRRIMSVPPLRLRSESGRRAEMLIDPGPARRRSPCRAPSRCAWASWDRPRSRRGCG